MKKIALYCLAGLLAATPVFSQNADDELEKLRKKLAAVELERDNLQLDVDKLKSDLEGKTSDYNDLKSTYIKTKTAYDDLKSATDKSKVDNLQKDFDEQKKELDELKGKYKDLETENRNLKKLQKNLVPKDSVKALKSRINNLNREKEKLENNNNNLQKEAGKVDGLEKRIELLKKDTLTKATRINVLIADCNKAKEAVNGLEQELGALNAFKVKWLKDLAANVDNEWLSKKYSQVDMARLEDAYAQYEEFGKNDKEVAAARDKMTPFVEKCRLFAKGTAAINSPYDKVLVDSIVPGVLRMRDAEQDQANKDDLIALARQLGDYKQIVGAFQDLKKDIDNVIAKRPGDKHKVVYPMVKAVISNYTDDETIDAIQDIPYLKQQYEKYTEALKEDCTKEYTLELIKN